MFVENATRVRTWYESLFHVLSWNKIPVYLSERLTHVAIKFPVLVCIAHRERHRNPRGKYRHQGASISLPARYGRTGNWRANRFISLFWLEICCVRVRCDCCIYLILNIFCSKSLVRLFDRYIHSRESTIPLRPLFDLNMAFSGDAGEMDCACKLNMI